MESFDGVTRCISRIKRERGAQEEDKESGESRRRSMGKVRRVESDAVIVGFWTRGKDGTEDNT